MIRDIERESVGGGGDWGGQNQHSSFVDPPKRAAVQPQRGHGHWRLTRTGQAARLSDEVKLKKGNSDLNVQEVHMRASLHIWRGLWLAVVMIGVAPLVHAQDEASPATMRPVIRGQQAAATSMKAEATEAARRILQAGGNAFDAAVGGQAALGVTDFASNGAGSDAMILLYDARTKKVFSINAEPRAPRLATIEWYQEHNGGKIPESD